jgi:hypothetical protein
MPAGSSLETVRAIATRRGDRASRVKDAAECIRGARDYHWLSSRSS